MDDTSGEPNHCGEQALSSAGHLQPDVADGSSLVRPVSYVVAVGVPGLICPDDVQEGVVVIDVGINPVPGKDGRVRWWATPTLPCPAAPPRSLRAGAERGDPSRMPSSSWDAGSRL